MTIGECIRKARKKAGLTQLQLAEQSGVATISIHQYESGKRQPRLEPLRQIALALGVTVSDLVDPSYWSTLTDEDKENAFSSDVPAVATPTPSARDRVNAAMDQMTPAGQSRVADYAEDILLRYKAGKATQKGGESTPPAREGNDTTPEEKPPESP